MMRLESHVATASSDFEIARSIAAAAEAHDGISPVSDQALIAAAQGERQLTLFAEAPEQDHRAFGVLGQGELDLVVAPEARGRGIGGAALRALLAGAEALSGAPAILAWVHGENPAAEALLTRAGFDPVRSLYRMTLDPVRLPARDTELDDLDVPSDLRLRAFDPSDHDDPGKWVRANAAAFATHPEQGRITEADFELLRSEAWFAPEDLLLLVATEGADAGEVIASTWIKTVQGEEVETELYALGVRPEYGGRGLGRLLLEATLVRMAQHDPERVSLYVDGDNRRAVELYEHAGFTSDSLSRQWRRAPVSVPGATMDP